MDKKDKFYDVSDDTIDTFNEVFAKKSFPVGIKFDFMGTSKQKGMIKIAVIPERYAIRMGKDISVLINEDLMDAYNEDELVSILIEQELDKLSVNMETGKIKLNPLRLITSPGIVEKYGIEKVSRANNVEELSSKQMEGGLI